MLILAQAEDIQVLKLRDIITITISERNDEGFNSHFLNLEIKKFVML